MSGFSGRYDYTVDPKGRIMIPAPFREIIAARYSPRLFITSAAFSKCLHIYPLEEWSNLQERVRTLPQMDEAVEYFMRRVVASAVETMLDRQGRVLIPVAHRQDLGINGDVVIVGQIEKLEVWDKALWYEANDPSKVDVVAYRSRLSGLGL